MNSNANRQQKPPDEPRPSLRLFQGDEQPAAPEPPETLQAKIDKLTSLVERLAANQSEPTPTQPIPTAESAPTLKPVEQNPRYMIWNSAVEVPAESIECLPPLGRLTLRDVYEKHLDAADAKRLKTSTHKGHQQTTLPRWELLGTSAPKRWYADGFGQMAYEVLGPPIANPPAGWIVAEDLIRFAWAHYAKDAPKKYSPGSHKSVLAQVSAWLKRLRPQASGGLGAIFVVPIVDFALLPADPVKPKFVPTEAEIQKLFEVAPPTLKCLLAFEWICGVRRGDAKKLVFEHCSEDLTTLSFVASKTERKRPYPKNLPLHPCATAWLMWAREQACVSSLFLKPRSPIFAVLKNLKKYGLLWKDCLEKAGLSSTTEDALGRHVEKFTLKRMRAACNVLLNDQGERAGEFVLHSSSKVNDVHYSPVYDPTPEQRRLILSTPVPDWLWPPGRAPQS